MADSSLKLLPGYRFHPTDEEIIANYLIPKTVNSSYTTPVIGEVGLKIDVGEKMESVVQELFMDNVTMPSLVDVSSLMDVSHFNSIESLSSYTRLMTTDGREKMKFVAQKLLPETVTLPSLMVVADFYSTPALVDNSNFSSGNLVCPENSLVNKRDIEATFDYFRNSYAYGAPVCPQIYDPYFDDQGTFDDESDCAIGRHTFEDEVWNHKMMVGALQDTAGTRTDWNMDDLWMLKAKEMGCYDVENPDDAKKM